MTILIPEHIPACPLPWHEALKGDTFWYLCHPYMAHQGSFEASFKEANLVAGLLIKSGVHVLSPISHSHPIAMECRMDETSHDLWMPEDLAILRGANGVLINPSPGWRLSKGIRMELDEAYRLGKPVYKLDLDW